MSDTTPEHPATTGRDTVLDYLHSRGVLNDDAADVWLTELTGGVSGEAILVEVGLQRVVVKRALGKLLVRDEWLAKPERAVTEAAAIEVLHGITPEQTPELLDVDPERFTLVMSAAPGTWVPWKTRLLGNHLDAPSEIETARELGQVLGTWHRRTRSDAEVAARFDDYEAFEQLRIGPFHRVVAGRHPDVAAAIAVCIEDLETRRDCLVHGDYSPKNVLVGEAASPVGSGLMVLDFEVAHYGAAVFDTAYMQCHLLLKAAHRPHNALLFRRLAEEFLDGYTGLAVQDPGPHLGWHTACLLLARVDGTSPSGYLDESGEALVRRLALHALRADQPRIDHIWDVAVDTTRQASS